MKILGVPALSIWPDLAIEALLRLGGTFQPTRESLWQLSSRVRDQVKVRWPRIYQWEHGHRWGDQLRDMLKRHVDVVTADLPQKYRGTVHCDFEIEGRTHKVAFNVSDYPDFVDDQCTRESLLTFKFQYRKRGYQERRIVPGGYLPGSPMLYKMLSYLRWSKDHLPPQFDVYGRFCIDFSPTVRGEALRHMAERAPFRYCGGGRLVRYSRSLREAARSRVCLDLPGQGPLCFRLIEYLAIGSCIVALPHGVVLLGSLLDGVHVAYCSNGPGEMVERCRALLDDPAQQRTMVEAARQYFDRCLDRDQLSAYYLNTVFAAAGIA